MKKYCLAVILLFMQLTAGAGQEAATLSAVSLSSAHPRTSSYADTTSSVQVPTASATIISFEQARRIILLTNGSLTAADFEIKAAQANEKTASVVPNPVASIELERFGANEIEATIEQTIELGGKRRLRTAAAKKETDAVQIVRALTLLELESEMVRRAVSVFSASRKLVLLDSIIGIAQMTHDKIGMRVEAGASKKSDFLRAELEIDKLRIERENILQNMLRARTSFAALGSVENPELINVSGAIVEQPIFPSLDSMLSAIRLHPQVKSFDIESENREILKRQIKAGAVPDLDVTAGYLRDNRDKSYSPLIGCAIMVPLFNKTSAILAMTGLQEQAALKRRSYTITQLETAVVNLHGRLCETGRTIEVLKTVTIPKTEQVNVMLQEYYAMGNVTFTELAAIQSELLRTKMEMIELTTLQALDCADLMQMTNTAIKIVN